MSEPTTAFLVLMGIIIASSGIRGWFLLIDNIRRKRHNWEVHPIPIWTYPGMLVVVGLILTGIYYILLWAYHSIMETYSYVCNWL